MDAAHSRHAVLCGGAVSVVTPSLIFAQLLLMLTLDLGHQFITLNSGGIDRIEPLVATRHASPVGHVIPNRATAEHDFAALGTIQCFPGRQAVANQANVCGAARRTGVRFTQIVRCQ